MRQITAREKAFLSIGALAAVALFVYFILLPWLQGGGSGPMSSLEEMEAKLEAFEKLEVLGQPLIALEEKMKSHSGYENISFRSGTANSVIISIINNYLSEAANRAGVRNLEQLDTKVDTKGSKVATINSKAVLASVVDRLHLQQVKSDLERIDAMEAEKVDSEAASLFDENADENSEAGANPDPDASDENADSEENTDQDSGNPAEPADAEAPNESEDASENPEQADSKILIFPVVPNDLPGEVRDSLVRFMENHNGKTLLNNNIDEIIDDVGFSDEKERVRIKKRLQLYNSRVKEKKTEIAKWFETLGVLKASNTGPKMGKFSVKMVFKSQIQQLVDLLYNLQNSARWLKVESLRISIADRKQTLLGVELNMTATTLRDI